MNKIKQISLVILLSLIIHINVYPFMFIAPPGNANIIFTENANTWRGIFVKEVKSILYPACGIDTKIISTMLKKFPDVTNIHLVDDGSQYSISTILSAFNSFLQRGLGFSLITHSSNITRSFSILVIPYLSWQHKYFWFKLKHPEIQREITIHVHKHDYLSLGRIEGLPNGIDITIVKFPGKYGNLTASTNDEFYQKIYSHTRFGGYIYICAAHCPGEKSMRDNLPIIDSSWDQMDWDSQNIINNKRFWINKSEYLTLKKIDPKEKHINSKTGTLVREFDVIKLVWDRVPNKEIKDAIHAYADQTGGGFSIGQGYSINAYNYGDHYIEFCFKCIKGKRPPCTLSFQSSLKDAEVLIVGPGPTAKEIIKFIKLFPDLKAIHLLDTERNAFENIDRELKAYQSTRSLPLIYAYIGNIVKLPEELVNMLKEKMDVVYEANVFFFSDFSEKQIFEALKLLKVLLKIGGIYASATNRKQIPIGHPAMSNLFHTWAVANDPEGLGNVCISIKTSDARHLESVGRASKNRSIGVNFKSKRVLKESL